MLYRNLSISFSATISSIQLLDVVNTRQFRYIRNLKSIGFSATRQ